MEVPSSKLNTIKRFQVSGVRGERRWQVAEEFAVYFANDEVFLQGWPNTSV